MRTLPNNVHVRTRFDGSVFVPDAPVDLPPGSTLEGNAKRLKSTEEIQTILNGLAGAWSDFEFEEPEELPFEDEEF